MRKNKFSVLTLHLFIRIAVVDLICFLLSFFVFAAVSDQWLRALIQAGCILATVAMIYSLPQEAGNFRALLQEYVQARSKALPVYSSRDADGGVVCTVSALGESATACAPTKKLAERAAARCLFGKLSKQ